MAKKHKLDEEKTIRPRKREAEERARRQAGSAEVETLDLAGLQRRIGNRAM